MVVYRFLENRFWLDIRKTGFEIPGIMASQLLCSCIPRNTKLVFWISSQNQFSEYLYTIQSLIKTVQVRRNHCAALYSQATSQLWMKVYTQCTHWSDSYVPEQTLYCRIRILIPLGYNLYHLYYTLQIINVLLFFSLIINNMKGTLLNNVVVIQISMSPWRKAVTSKWVFFEQKPSEIQL